MTPDLPPALATDLVVCPACDSTILVAHAPAGSVIVTQYCDWCSTRLAVAVEGPEGPRVLDLDAQGFGEVEPLRFLDTA